MKTIALSFLLFSTVAFAEANPITWWDGENESKVWVEERFVATLQYPKVKNAAPLVTLVAVKNPNQRKLLLKRGQVVFRNAEMNGQKMVAVGNILVRFQPALDDKAAEIWAKEHSTSIIEKISVEPSSYLMTSEAGMASINKANEWRSLPGVKGAEPIWWKEMELR